MEFINAWTVGVLVILLWHYNTPPDLIYGTVLAAGGVRLCAWARRILANDLN